jgi:HD-like signal output (HDOD) protein
VDVESFWRNNVSAGVLARELARRAGLEEPERFFVAGLLREAGRLILFNAHPGKAREAIDLVLDTGTFLFQAEAEVFGHEQSALGADMLERWNFSEEQVMAVRYYLCPAAAIHIREAGIVHLADLMCRALALGLSGEYFMPFVSDAAWRALGFSPGIFEEVESATREEIGHMVEILLTDPFESRR